MPDGAKPPVDIVVACCDGPKCLSLLKEPLDRVAITVKVLIERRDVLSVWHRLDIGPCAPFGQDLAGVVAVISAISKKDGSLDQAVQHVVGTASVMGLPFGDFEEDRHPVDTDKRMDFCCQPPRERPMQRASIFFLALAAC